MLSPDRRGAASKNTDDENLKNALPLWLDDLRDEMMVSPEWQALTKRVYHSVQDRLKQNHIQFFSDLNDVEKSLFIDEVERSLAADHVYKSFQGVLSRGLDECLSNEVETKLLKSGSTRDNKVNMILDLAADGATKLLKRLPGEKSTLRVMLNHELPGPLRKQAWGMYLGHPEARTKYDRDVLTSRMGTMSDHDADISSKCQAMIDTKFREVETHRSGTLISLMKTTLSYYEVLTQRDLEETFYYLCVPLSWVWCSTFTEAGAVIEAYVALLEMPRPKYIMTVTEELAKTLQAQDTELFDYIANINATATAGTSLSGVTTDTFIGNLLKDAVLRLFVGTLSLPVCCYVWDQALILGSFEKIVPSFAITLLLILRDQLLASPTPEQLQRTISNHSSTIELRHFQGMAERLFMNKMRNKLGIQRDFGGDLYEAVDFENQQFEKSVPGLDQSMDWESFALSSSMGGPRSPTRRKTAARAISQHEDVMKIPDTQHYSSANTYKVEDNVVVKKRFDDHLQKDSIKREENERKKLQERRRQAVADAEEELALAEEERDAELHNQNIAQKRALMARREQFEEHRRKREHQIRELEAKTLKSREDESKRMMDAERAKLELATQFDEDLVADKEAKEKSLQNARTNARGDNYEVTRPVYLGAETAPIMKIKLKRSDGSEQKVEMRGLVQGDTEDDARVRVEEALTSQGISVERAPKIMKALYTWSKKKTGYKGDWSGGTPSPTKMSVESTPGNSGRSTPTGRDPDAEESVEYAVVFHAENIGITFEDSKRKEDSIGSAVRRVSPSSEGAVNAMVWPGDKVLSVAGQDVRSLNPEEVSNKVSAASRPVSLRFEKYRPNMGGANMQSSEISLRDAKNKKIKLPFKSLGPPEHKGVAQQRAIWLCLINDLNVSNAMKICSEIVNYSKKRGYNPPEAPLPEEEEIVKKDKPLGFGEYDIHLPEGKNLGVKLDNSDENDVQVKMISGGYAEEKGGVEVGDILVMVADSVVLGQSTKDVLAFLQKQERPIRLRFRKSFKSREEERAARKKAEEDAVKAEELQKLREEAELKAKYAAAKVELEEVDGKIRFNGHTPLVASVMAVIEGLNLIAFGDDHEQSILHEQVNKEDEGILEDFTTAQTKHWGSKLSKAEIAAFSATQSAKYNKMLPKIKRSATDHYKARIKASKKK
jgi:hypothetical protein